MEAARRLEATSVIHKETKRGLKDPRKASENQRSRREGKEGLGREEWEGLDRPGPHLVDQGLEGERLVRTRAL